LLEAFIMEKAWILQRVGTGFGQAIDEKGVWRADVKRVGGEVPPPPSPKSTPMTQVWAGLKENSYAQSAARSGYWDVLDCVFPQSTVVESYRSGSSRSLVFRKPRYFEITFQIKPTGIGVSYPRGYVVRGFEHPAACAYDIDVLLRFDRLTSQNGNTEGIKAWSNALARAILNKLPH
jgi:hypothetical protein